MRVAVLAGVLADETVLEVEVVLAGVLPVDLAGVAILPVVLTGVLLLAALDVLGVVDFALVVDFVVAAGFTVEVREDTTDEPPVVFLAVSFDGVEATVLVVLVDFLPDARFEVELGRAGLGVSAGLRVSDGLRGGVFLSDMQNCFPCQLRYPFIVPCQ